MNKLYTMVVAAAFGTITGMAEDLAPTGPPVAALEPGMAWKVESLPGAQAVLESPERSGAATQESDAEKPKSMVVEENVIGNGFRLQKKTLQPGNTQTILIQDDRFFILLADGVSYSVDFPDPEIPWTLVNSKRFREFDWVESQWWTERRIVDGVECDVYRRPWHPGLTADEAAKRGDTGEVESVAIAHGDRFPRRWETPGKIYRYVSQPRVSPPDLPAAAAEAARELEERLERQANRYRIPQ